MRLPSAYIDHYRLHEMTIRERLAQFRAVPPEEWFWELAFCLLTPQSRAANAEQVIAKLRAAGFPHTPINPAPILRDPAHYIRFHNVKALRLILLAKQEQELRAVLASALSSGEKREWLVQHVNGLGWKEASHFLRNIGHLDLAIIDRHILKHLLLSGAIEEMPKTLTKRVYLNLEECFAALAETYGLTLQQLDLLFWSYEEGSVRK